MDLAYCLLCTVSKSVHIYLKNWNFWTKTSKRHQCWVLVQGKERERERERERGRKEGKRDEKGGKRQRARERERERERERKTDRQTDKDRQTDHSYVADSPLWQGQSEQVKSWDIFLSSRPRCEHSHQTENHTLAKHMVQSCIMLWVANNSNCVYHD